MKRVTKRITAVWLPGTGTSFPISVMASAPPLHPLGGVLAAPDLERVVGKPGHQIPDLLRRPEPGFGPVGVHVLANHYLPLVAPGHADATAGQGGEHLADVLRAELVEIRQATVIGQKQERDRAVVAGG